MFAEQKKRLLQNQIQTNALYVEKEEALKSYAFHNYKKPDIHIEKESLTEEQVQQLLDVKNEIDELYHILQEEIMAKTIRDHTNYKFQKKHSGIALRRMAYPPNSPLIDYDEWKNTFFFIHPSVAHDLYKYSLHESTLKSIRHAQKFPSIPYAKIEPYAYKEHLVSCEAVMQTEKGPRLVIADPYGKVITDATDILTFEQANNLIGKIIIIEIGHRFESNSHPIRSYKETGFYKYE